MSVVRQQCPDLVIVDLHMREMDGLQFVDACRNITECLDIPIVLATGDGDTPRTRGLLEGKGTVLIVAKPFDLDLLTAVIREAIQDHARR